MSSLRDRHTRLQETAMKQTPRKVKPQTQIFSKGYDPQLSEGAATPPVFRTSTFIFKTAQEGKSAFEVAYGLRPLRDGESSALIYTRVNNPNCEMVEDKITAWDGAEAAALFSSGMGAISTTCMTFLRPGDTLVFSDPVYGGTEFFFRKLLPNFNIRTIPFPAGSSAEHLDGLVRKDPTVKVVYLETPANPTIVLSDVAAARAVADRYSDGQRRVRVMVDNTFLGPIFFSPMRFGADIVLYSATKFIGGHSDLVAGIALGSKADIGAVKVGRTIYGSISDADTAWLILRSLGTLQIRMEKQQENALKIVEFLREHPKVTKVAYPGLPEMGESQVGLFRAQCTGTGSLLSVWVDGGEGEAFKLLDALGSFKLAVSLGGIESLVQHPSSMTHSDMTEEEKAAAGISPNMVRVSVGLEDADDLVADLDAALGCI